MFLFLIPNQESNTRGMDKIDYLHTREGTWKYCIHVQMCTHREGLKDNRNIW